MVDEQNPEDPELAAEYVRPLVRAIKIRVEADVDRWLREMKERESK